MKNSKCRKFVALLTLGLSLQSFQVSISPSAYAINEISRDSIGVTGDEVGSVSLPFSTQESIDRLARTPYKAAFLTLANHYKPQENRFFCGVTTGVIVLNALRSFMGSTFTRPMDLTKFDVSDPSVPLPFIPVIPGSPLSPVFERYTETTFFNARTDQVKTKDQVYGVKSDISGISPGISLDEMHAFLLAHDLNSTLFYVDVEDRAQWNAQITALKEALGTPGVHVIVNYDRKTLAQRGKGHFSPLGAYDPVSDSFLILDVNPSVQEWVWADSLTLFKAMAINHRGYLIVREGKALD